MLAMQVFDEVREAATLGVLAVTGANKIGDNAKNEINVNYKN